MTAMGCSPSSRKLEKMRSYPQTEWGKCCSSVKNEERERERCWSLIQVKKEEDSFALAYNFRRMSVRNIVNACTWLLVPHDKDHHGSKSPNIEPRYCESLQRLPLAGLYNKLYPSLSVSFSLYNTSPTSSGAGASSTVSLYNTTSIIRWCWRSKSLK